MVFVSGRFVPAMALLFQRGTALARRLHEHQLRDPASLASARHRCSQERSSATAPAAR